MYLRFAGLWEQAKAQHRAEVGARATQFRSEFQKKTLWFYLSLLLPYFFRQYIAEREVVRITAARIVAQYMPQIRAGLVQLQSGFDRWERENRCFGCGTGDAIREEDEGRELAWRLSDEMLQKIGAIPSYGMYFQMVENPHKMVENPYPGYLSTQRARNYCDALMKAFS